MAYNETGHARNVANFEALVMIVTTMGATYKPVAEGIQVEVLEKTKDTLREGLQNVNDKIVAYRDKVYVRQNLYEQMNNLAARIVNTIEGLGIDNKILLQAKSILTKIRGKGGNRKKVEANTTLPAPKSISVSQLSFEQRKNNFSLLVALVNEQGAYKPNEEDIQINTLQKYIINLQNSNEEVNQADHNLTLARNQRDVLLYAENTGAVMLAQQIKAYIKGAFGANSVEFSHVKGIIFNKK